MAGANAAKLQAILRGAMAPPMGADPFGGLAKPMMSKQRAPELIDFLRGEAPQAQYGRDIPPTPAESRLYDRLDERSASLVPLDEGYASDVELLNYPEGGSIEGGFEPAGAGEPQTDRGLERAFDRQAPEGFPEEWFNPDEPSLADTRLMGPRSVGTRDPAMALAFEQPLLEPPPLDRALENIARDRANAARDSRQRRSNITPAAQMAAPFVDMAIDPDARRRLGGVGRDVAGDIGNWFIENAPAISLAARGIPTGQVEPVDLQQASRDVARGARSLGASASDAISDAEAWTQEQTPESLIRRALVGNPDRLREGLVDVAEATPDFLRDITVGPWEGADQYQSELELQRQRYNLGLLDDRGVIDDLADARNAETGWAAVNLLGALPFGSGSRVAREAVGDVAVRTADDAPFLFEGAERPAGEVIDAVARPVPARRFQAAVRDPETGQVYDVGRNADGSTRPAQDHREALDGIEDDAVRTRLEALYDAPVEDPSAIGFMVDGQFMGREEGMAALRAQRRPVRHGIDEVDVSRAANGQGEIRPRSPIDWDAPARLPEDQQWFERLAGVSDQQPRSIDAAGPSDGLPSRSLGPTQALDAGNGGGGQSRAPRRIVDIRTPRGETHETIVNPTEADILRLTRPGRSAAPGLAIERGLPVSSSRGVRYIKDAEGNIYVGNSYDVTHHDLVTHYGLPNRGSLDGGEIVRLPDGTLELQNNDGAMPLPRGWLNGRAPRSPDGGNGGANLDDIAPRLGDSQPRNIEARASSGMPQRRLGSPVSDVNSAPARPVSEAGTNADSPQLRGTGNAREPERFWDDRLSDQQNAVARWARTGRSAPQIADEMLREGIEISPETVRVQLNRIKTRAPDVYESIGPARTGRVSSPDTMMWRAVRIADELAANGQGGRGSTAIIADRLGITLEQAKSHVAQGNRLRRLGRAPTSLSRNSSDPLGSIAPGNRRPTGSITDDPMGIIPPQGLDTTPSVGDPVDMRQARGDRLGFDMDTEWYRGVSGDHEIRPYSMWTNDPAEASAFAQGAALTNTGENANVIPARLRGVNGRNIDDEILEALDNGDDPDIIARQIIDAEGLDWVEFEHPNAAGGAVNQTVRMMRDPANIRSRFAAFDPARSNSRDLLAGIAAPAAVGLGTGGALLGGDAEAQDMDGGEALQAYGEEEDFFGPSWRVVAPRGGDIPSVRGLDVIAVGGEGNQYAIMRDSVSGRTFYARVDRRPAGGEYMDPAGLSIDVLGELEPTGQAAEQTDVGRRVGNEQDWFAAARPVLSAGIGAALASRIRGRPFSAGSVGAGSAIGADYLMGGRDAEPVAAAAGALGLRFGVPAIRDDVAREGYLRGPDFAARRDAFARNLSDEAPTLRSTNVRGDIPMASGGVRLEVPQAEAAQEGYARTLGGDAPSPRQQFLNLDPADQAAWIDRDEAMWADRGQMLDEITASRAQPRLLGASSDIPESGFPVGFFDPRTGEPLFGSAGRRPPPRQQRRAFDELSPSGQARRVGSASDQVEAAREMGVGEFQTGAAAMRAIRERAAADPSFMQMLRERYPMIAAAILGGATAGEMMDELAPAPQ